MHHKLQAIWDSASAWGWPAKFLTGAVVSAFAGGGVLSFLLQNAAYSYALTYGFRPPVEGIPYLVPMVAFASISLLVLAAVLMLILTILIKYFGIRMIEFVDAQGARHSSRKSLLLKFRELPLKFAIIAIVIFAILIVAVRQLLPLSFAFEQLEICAWPLLLCSPVGGGNFNALLLEYFIGVLILLMIWRPNFAWAGTFLLVASYYIWIATAVLPAEGYGRLLRMTGFGGGLHVKLYLEGNGMSPSRSLDTYLLLRSSGHVFVYSPGEARIREYPISSISEIDHNVGGLHNLSWQLPASVNLMQR